ncbi:MAG: hypothetical protein ACE5MB_07550 [Anaerolineae bacterium]
MLSRLILVLFVVLALVVILAPVPLAAGEPAEHYIRLEARSFAFDPPVVQVNRGDRVILELESVDVTHGLYLEGYGINITAPPGLKARAEFVAHKAGKFRYRCSANCGSLHPFMMGELIVAPNTPYLRAVGLTITAAVGALAYLWAEGRQPR